MADPYSPITPLIDRRKAKSFLAATKELGRPWYGQLMAGPQLIAYYIQLNFWLKEYNISL
jgi:asparagine synthase (glutamine-hydrolysing)